MTPRTLAHFAEEFRVLRTRLGPVAVVLNDPRALHRVDVPLPTVVAVDPAEVGVLRQQPNAVKQVFLILDFLFRSPDAECQVP